jgi:hypothetical protein
MHAGSNAVGRSGETRRRSSGGGRRDARDGNGSDMNTKRMSRIRKHIRIFTRFRRQHLLIFFIDELRLQNHKVLVHNKDRSLKISQSSLFILINSFIINKTINKNIFLIYIHYQTNKKYMKNISSIHK